MTVILVARDSQENLLSVSQRDWNVRFNNTQRGDFEKSTVTVRDQLQTTGLQSLNNQAILQLSGTALASGSTTVQIPDAAGSGFRLTSILLSNRAEQATCSDAADSLCFMNVRLYQPVTSKFTSSGRLIVYFAPSDLSLHPQTKKPWLGAAFTLKSGSDVWETALAGNIHSLTSPDPTSASVLHVCCFVPGY